ncbi:MAG: hypothetical protein ABIH04_00250 [Planctomycetota bacterium]
MGERSADNVFAVVLPEITDADIVELVKDELAKTFTLLKRTAATIIDSAPIILIEDATREEADSLQKHFKDVTGATLGIHLRCELDGQWPRLSWPRRPAVLRELLSAAGQTANSENRFGEVEYVESNVGVREMILDAEGGKEVATQTAATAEVPVPPPNPKSAPKKRGIPDFMKKQEDENDTFAYNVFLSGVPSEAKKQRAIELICELKGISELEASELMTRTIIPIAKDLTRAQSEEIEKLFHESRLNVRVMKKNK